MLDGFTVLPNFESFIYKNNVFMMDALAGLKPLLVRPSPMNLQELRLVNLKTNKVVIQNLIDFLTEQNVQLRSLSLVQLHIGRTSMRKVAKFLTFSGYLESLDLSWNDTRPWHFVPLLEALAQNRTLRSINLSWNNLLEKNDMNNPLDIQTESLLDDYVKARAAAMSAGKGEIKEDTSWQNDHPKYVIYCLS